MREQVILDTGPLVAFLNARDHDHQWAVTQFGQIRPPLLTCEAVLSEAFFLLRNWKHGTASIFALLERQVLQIAFSLADDLDPVSRIMNKYANVPASLADACLVRMAERHDRSAVLTLDAGFRIYRKHQRKVIPLLVPTAIGGP